MHEPYVFADKKENQLKVSTEFEILKEILLTANEPLASIRDDLKFSYFSGLINKNIRKDYKPRVNKKCSQTFSAYTEATHFDGSIKDIIDIVKNGKAIAGKWYKNYYCNNENVLDNSIDLFIADIGHPVA